jgi:uncharacterized protein (TIGR02996 family)
MSDVELVAAIRDKPSDDAPRLVYADVLMRRRDPRGEYIALACDGAQRRAHADLGDDYVARTLREWSLLREHRSSWLAESGFVADKSLRYRWNRGFVSEVFASSSDAVLQMREALLTLPIEVLQISDLTRAAVPKLVASDVLSAAPTLMLSQYRADDPLDAESVRVLLRADLAALESFSLQLRRFPGDVDLIASAPNLARVSSLHIGEDLGEPVLLSAVGRWSAALSELGVTTDRIAPAAYERLFADPALAALERLTIWSRRPDEGDVIVRAIAASPLRCLSKLCVIDVSASGIDALVDAPSLRRVRAVRLRNVVLDGSAMRRLLASAPAIEELRLSGRLDQGAVDAIAAGASPSLKNLVVYTDSERLDLRPLVSTSRYALREIDVRADSVNDDFFTALAATPFARALTSVTFAGPMIERGTRALAASHDLQPGVQILWVGQSAETEATRALEKRFPLFDRAM